MSFVTNTIIINMMIMKYQTLVVCRDEMCMDRAVDMTVEEEDGMLLIRTLSIDTSTAIKHILFWSTMFESNSIHRHTNG